MKETHYFLFGSSLLFTLPVSSLESSTAIFGQYTAILESECMKETYSVLAFRRRELRLALSDFQIVGL